MAKRTDLDAVLREVLGSSHTYFQPPETVKLVYPCIIYYRYKGVANNADDTCYLYNKSYTLTFVDKNPDSLIPDKLQMLPKCSFERFYTADNLNHWVFTIYY